MYGEMIDFLNKSCVQICEFLYETAEKFNEFYRECMVVGDPLQNQRLVICEGVAEVMRKAFSILGITPVDKL